MNDSGIMTGIFGLGIFGFVIGIVVWLVATIITGYFLGLGIWAAMPREMKNALRSRQ